jgi:hypothetical protein
MRNAALSLFALSVSAICFAAGRDVTGPTYGAISLVSTAPSVAGLADRFVTVWATEGHLYESIADRSGDVLTPVAVPIAGNLTGPAQIVASGDHFVILTWINKSAALLSLSADGALLGVVSLPSLPQPANPQIVADGDEFLIADSIGPYTPVTAHIIRSDGTVVRSNIPVAKSALAFDSTAVNHEWLVATSEPPKVFVQRIGRDGVVRARFQISGVERTPDRIAMASDGTQAILLGLENFVAGASSFQKLWSAVVSSDAQIGALKQLALPSTLPNTPFLSTVLLRWTGNTYLGVVSGQQAFAFRVDSAGAELESPVLLGEAVDSFATLGGIAYAAGRHFSFSELTHPTIGTSFHFDGAISAMKSNVISIGLRQQLSPVVATDGVNFFVVWRDQTADIDGIAAARIARDGTLLDPAGIEVVSAPRSPSNALVAVAYGDSTYAVVWSDLKSTYVRRFRTDGSPIDAAPIVAIPNATAYPAPAIAWNGTAFEIVSTDSQGTVGAFLQAQGGPSQTVRIDTAKFLWPRLAWNGHVFLLIGGIGQSCAYECPVQHGPTMAMRLNAGGTPLDTSPILIDAPSPASYVTTRRASVASDGKDFLVSIDRGQNVTVIPVTSDLVVGQPKDVFKWFGGTSADIAYGPTGYVLSWNYPGPTPTESWLATAHLTAAGDPYSDVDTMLESGISNASVAVNDVGDVMTALDVRDPASGATRTKAYFHWEMTPMPAPPNRPPDNARAVGMRHSFELRWDSVSSDTAGVLVEYVQANGVRYPVGGIFPADQHSVLFKDFYASMLELRAFNAGGLSEPVDVSIDSLPPRRRAN